MDRITGFDKVPSSEHLAGHSSAMFTLPPIWTGGMKEQAQMRRSFLVIALLAGFIIRVQPCLGQDALAADEVNALKGLRSVAVVLRPTTYKEVATVKEWHDMVRVRLARDAPAISVSDSTSSPSVDWLDLRVITTDRGAVLRLSLYRWFGVPVKTYSLRSGRTCELSLVMFPDAVCRTLWML